MGQRYYGVSIFGSISWKESGCSLCLMHSLGSDSFVNLFIYLELYKCSESLNYAFGLSGCAWISSLVLVQTDSGVRSLVWSVEFSLVAIDWGGVF